MEWRLILLAALIATIVLLTTAAISQDGHLGHGHEKWHQGFYQGLQRPDNGGSYCNLTDCRPTSGRIIDGGYEVKIDGVWRRVPQSKIVKRSAPDGGFHVCAQPSYSGQPGEILCVVLAPEG